MADHHAHRDPEADGDSVGSGSDGDSVGVSGRADRDSVGSGGEPDDSKGSGGEPDDSVGSGGGADDSKGSGGGADRDGRARPSDHERRLKTLGDYIRLQRNLANLSMRQMAELAQISNPYLSQIERGVHEPSMHILGSIARALGVSIESLLTEAGLIDPKSDGKTPEMESAIRHDPHLSESQKSALLAVYRSYVGQSARVDQTPEDPPSSR